MTSEDMAVTDDKEDSAPAQTTADAKEDGEEDGEEQKSQDSNDQDKVKGKEDKANDSEDTAAQQNSVDKEPNEDDSRVQKSDEPQKMSDALEQKSADVQGPTSNEKHSKDTEQQHEEQGAAAQEVPSSLPPPVFPPGVPLPAEGKLATAAPPAEVAAASSAAKEGPGRAPPKPPPAIDSMQVWTEFRQTFRNYMRRLAVDAQQEATASGNAEADLSKSGLAAAALGGARSEQICMNYLARACRRGMRCVDRHPLRSQFESCIRELKRKQCVFGDACFRPRCYFFHPRESAAGTAAGESIDDMKSKAKKIAEGSALAANLPVPPPAPPRPAPPPPPPAPPPVPAEAAATAGKDSQVGLESSPV
eukprot:TRINITY_DN7053_c0_g1_i1.p1 TRINITY_DN7053_c0_g1~~TRINITY_DN7053_c0_g1_i1.p1  ORF type:complete len:362 (+),score=87.06 TRINITY_DN7053_c0_g1_i1:40-1125(+)